ncbi:MAG TPA: branched-chain amino acid ABC transporter permease [Candidatus Eisenbacteria bacterium]|nr:branched-chain amino acid ABC transporter permease [Candidatus Eisenbacteria bacterium]
MKRLLITAATLAALVVVQMTIPRLVNPYVFQIIVLCGINVILAVSLNLINGFTGQFSIGHAGFMALGGYASAMFSLHVGKGWVAALTGAGVPAVVAQGAALLVALVLGGLLAAVAGYFVGLPSLRLRGDYLAIVTLGFGEIIRVLIINVDAVGAAQGLPGIPQWTNLFWIGLFVVAVILLSRNLAHSTHGRALFAIRDDEVAAEALGVNTTAYKVLAFVIGAFFAGVAGGLSAHFVSYLNPSSFTFLRSIEIVAMVVLGGLGSVTGATLAAIVLTVLPEALRSALAYRMVIYALMLIVLMITRPQGLLGNREFSWKAVRDRLSRRRATGPAT